MAWVQQKHTHTRKAAKQTRNQVANWNWTCVFLLFDRTNELTACSIAASVVLAALMGRGGGMKRKTVKQSEKVNSKKYSNFNSEISNEEEEDEEEEKKRRW